MNSLEISVESKSLKMFIDKQKILIGSNYRKKYFMTRALCSYIRKESLSEFTIESNMETSVRFDGQRMDAKRWNVYVINSWLDFDDELKMGSKSIIMKFLESVLSEIEYDDNFQCLRSTINVLSDETIKSISDIFEEELLLNFSIDEFSFKSLIKLMTVSMLKEGHLAKDYNLEYDDKIFFYLTMIGSIAKKNPGSNYMVIIDSQDYSNRIKRSIERLPDNCKSIIISTNIMSPVNYNDILIVGRKDLDLGNENDLFEKICLDSAGEIDIDQTRNDLESLFAHSFRNMHNDRKIQAFL